MRNQEQTQPLFGQMMDYPLLLTQILRRCKKEIAKKEIITKTPSGELFRLTYGDFYKRVCQLGNAFNRLGVRPGDRIGTFAWNHHEHLELYFGIPSFGAVIHTLNIRYSIEQLIYVINHAEDRFIFVDTCLLPLFEKIAPHLKTVEKFILIGSPPSTQTTLHSSVFYEDLIGKEALDFEWPDLDERSAAGLCYTSGTTGNPKGVLYSHRSQFLHTYAIAMGDALGIRGADTLMAVVPMFHANAWGLPFAAAWTGANLVLPGPFLKPADLGKMIQECQVTLAAGVPTLWNGLYHEWKKAPGQIDLSSLRGVAAGGSAMPRSLISAIEEEMGIPVIHVWGMTELSPLGTSHGLLDLEKISSAEKCDLKIQQGPAVPGVELRISNENNSDLDWDGQTTGELQVRGPWVLSSYFGDPEGESRFTSDGWFKTGDVASITPNGSMVIHDRIKDVIKSGGEWISSVALENALMNHPKVFEAAVIGVLDEKWGERPLALMVPRETHSLPTIEELQAFLGEKFVKFWVPERFQWIKEIPKTSVGKFDKKQLRLRFLEPGSIHDGFN